MDISVTIKVIKQIDQTDSTRQLIEQAIESAKKAYAPYSQFQVGAAVLLDNGEVICGNNQENAAYPSGLCAERVAMFYARANYPDVPVKSITIIALKEGRLMSPPVSPCGGCRQVLVEYEEQQRHPIQIILGSQDQTYLIAKCTDLLPLSFTGKHLLSK